MRWALLGVGLMVAGAAAGGLWRSLRPGFDPEMRSVVLFVCALFVLAGIGWIGLFTLADGWTPHYDPRPVSAS